MGEAGLNPTAFINPKECNIRGGVSVPGFYCEWVTAGSHPQPEPAHSPGHLQCPALPFSWSAALSLCVQSSSLRADQLDWGPKTRMHTNIQTYIPPSLVQGTPVSKVHPPFGPHFFLTGPYRGQGGGYKCLFIVAYHTSAYTS